MVMTSAMAAEVGAGQGTDRTGLGDVLHVDVREKRPREAGRGCFRF